MQLWPQEFRPNDHPEDAPHCQLSTGIFGQIKKVKDRWSRRLYNDSVILIGLPDHITCGFLHEPGSSYTLEYFDPAGKDGDRANIKKLRLVFLIISKS